MQPSVRTGLRRGSLRRQLIGSNIVVLALLLGALGLTIRYAVRSFLLTSVDQELERSLQPTQAPPSREHHHGGHHSEDLPDRDGRSHHSGQDGESPEPSNPVWQGSHRQYSQHHFDLQGRSVLRADMRPMWDPEGFALAKEGQKNFSTTEVDGEPLRVLTEPVSLRGETLVVQVAYPMGDVYRSLAGTDRVLLTLIPLGLLGAALGGAFVTDRVLRRVRRTNQVAEQMSAHDFSQRLPVSGNDEFSELAETFNGLLDRLDSAYRDQRRLLEQQRRFTADASHELKTPLTIIKGAAGLGLSGTRDESAYRRLLHNIDSAADTMSRLVQDLLLLARSDGGQLGKDLILLPVQEVLERAIACVHRSNSSPAIVLTVEPETLGIMGNESELMRLFSNLVENAVRHTPPPGAVHIAAGIEGPQLIVLVSDTGVGIAPEHLPHLGERFYRVDAARARTDGGTGLGLSICRGIVEAHKGTMTITSTLGVGTTVRVALFAEIAPTELHLLL